MSLWNLQFFFIFAIRGECLVFQTEPISVVARPNHNVMFDCRATLSNKFFHNNLPLITYRWLFNDTEIPRSSASLFPNNSLSITSPNSENSGAYQCLVAADGDAPSSIISSPAYLVLSYLEPFVIHPQSVNASSSESITLTCVSGNGAPLPLLEWEKDGNIIHDYDYDTGVYGEPILEGFAGQMSSSLLIHGDLSANGAYRCQAINQYTRETFYSEPANVTFFTVPQAPMMYESLKNNSSPEGRPFAWICPIKYGDIITWYKGNLQLYARDDLNVHPNGTLQFLSAKRHDSGSYYCVSTNGLGSLQSQTAFLTIAYIDLKFHILPSNTHSIAGRSVTLPCSPPNSFPRANVTWFKDNALIKPRTGTYEVSVLPRGDIFFRSVQLIDAGRYICVGINDLAVPSSRSAPEIELTVKSGPVILEPPLAAEVVQGKLLMLSCSITGDPEPSTSWLLNGRQVVPDERITIGSRGELIVSHSNKADEGSYQCSGKNKYGSVHSSPVFVRVMVIPYFAEMVSNTSAVEGESAVLPCVVLGDPEPTVTWYKDTDVILPNDDYRYESNGLHIRKVGKSDQGWYNCTGRSAAGSASSIGYLALNVAPTFVEAPENQYVTYAVSVVVTCNAQGVPAPQISWLFQGSDILPEGIETSHDNTTLYVISFGSRHNGTYSCLSSSAAGKAVHTFDMILDAKPTVSLIGASTTSIGHALNLTCIVSGSPMPDIEWLHDQVTVYEDITGNLRISADHSQLYVAHSQFYHAGTYTCRASNRAGVVSEEIYIFVRGKPRPPIRLSALPLTTTAVNLSWIPATQEHANNVDHYTVRFKTSNAPSYDIYRQHIPATRETARIEGLQVASDYMFMVAAVNEVGRGQWSEVAYVRTFEMAPSKPRQVKIFDTKARSTKLSWQIPSVTNGIIQFYQLHYRRTKLGPDAKYYVKQVSTVFPPPMTVAYTLTSLWAFTQYELRVRAATINSGTFLWGNFSETFTFTTKSAPPGSVPTEIRMFAKSPSEVLLTWHGIAEKDFNGINAGYVVEISAEKNPQKSIEVHPDDGNSTTIRNLTPYTFYSARVAARNQDGIGPFSVATKAQTLPTAPSVAPKIVRVETFPRNIQMKWNPIPEDQRNSRIDGYIITVGYEDSIVIQKINITNSDSIITIIRDLNPFTKYEIKMQAYTRLVNPGLSPFSEPHLIKTEEDRPGQIDVFTVTSSTPSSIQLSWLPPAVANGAILYYKIYWTKLEEKEANLARQSLNRTAIRKFGSEHWFSDTSRSERLSSSIATALPYKYSLTKLEPNTYYNIGLIAATKAGLSLNITILSAKTETAQLTTPAYTDIFEISTTVPSLPSLSDPLESKAGFNLMDFKLTRHNIPVVVGAALVGLVIVAGVVLLLYFTCCASNSKKIKKRKRRRRRPLNPNSSRLGLVPESPTATSVTTGSLPVSSNHRPTPPRSRSAQAVAGSERANSSILSNMATDGDRHPGLSLADLSFTEQDKQYIHDRYLRDLAAMNAAQPVRDDLASGKAMRKHRVDNLDAAAIAERKLLQSSPPGQQSTQEPTSRHTVIYDERTAL